MNDPVALLARSLGDHGAALLQPHLEERSLAEGEALFRDGVPSSFVYLVVDGEVDIRQEADGDTIALGSRGPGAWLGEVGFIDAGPATATVVARGPVRVLRIDHATLVRLATERPEAAGVLLRHVSREIALRIAESRSGILEHVGPGQYRIRHPEEVRTWVSQALGWLLGAGGRA